MREITLLCSKRFQVVVSFWNALAIFLFLFSIFASPFSTTIVAHKVSSKRECGQLGELYLARKFLLQVVQKIILSTELIFQVRHSSQKLRVWNDMEKRLCQNWQPSAAQDTSRICHMYPTRSLVWLQVTI